MRYLHCNNILSACDKYRFNSRKNHELYAKINGCNYIFDNSTREFKYDNKIAAILDLEIDNQWWFWLDDDAFFSQFNSPFSDFNLKVDDNVLIFPKSPVNKNGNFTFISSGNFFFKNCFLVKEFFKNVLSRDISTVRKWWKNDKFGLFTKGDQDKIVYELHHNPRINSLTMLTDYKVFNTRPYHFENSPDENFLVHFAGVGEKSIAINNFKEKFSFSDDSLTSRFTN